MKKRVGYTLIEMIFAITLMGLVGGIVSGILGKIYENYAIQQEVSKLEFSSIQILSQIENYLKRSIPNSILLHDGSKVAGVLDVYNENAYTPLRNINFGNGNLTANKTLLWLDIDKESLQGTGPQPFYNQWLDIKASTNNQIKTVDSQFNKIQETQNNIFGILNSTPAIYFIYGNQQGTPYQKFYNETAGSQSTAMFAVNTSIAPTANNLTLTRIPPEIGEMFYISGTGYALSLNGTILSLIYNFQPWELVGTNGETFLDGTKKVIAENVKSFDFWVEYDTLRMKICLFSNTTVSLDSTGADEKAYICKERAIGMM